MGDHSAEHVDAHRGGSYYVDPSYFHGNSEMANMPQDVTLKFYPKPAYGMDQSLDDTIRGVDMTQQESERQRKSHLSHQK